MRWEVNFHPEFRVEFNDFPDGVQDALLAEILLLKQFGPQLGRPHVDTLKASKHANMKELRFDANNGVWRCAFAFDNQRKAVMLYGGDKAGAGTENKFYKRLIMIADARFNSHLAKIEKEKKVTDKAKKGNKP